MATPLIEISDLKSRVNILDIVGQYTDLKQRGNNKYLTKCLFHNERTASAYVFTRTQTYHCFGCGVHYDVIDFLKAINNWSFQQARDYLLNITGFKQATDPKQMQALKSKIQDQQRRREAVQRFTKWCDYKHDELCLLYRTLQKNKVKIQTEQDLEDLAKWLHLESEWLFLIEILEGNDDREKLELYRRCAYGQ